MCVHVLTVILSLSVFQCDFAPQQRDTHTRTMSSLVTASESTSLTLCMCMCTRALDLIALRSFMVSLTGGRAQRQDTPSL